MQAIRKGDASQLGAMLAKDVELTTDSGGKVQAVTRILQGQEQVLSFIHKGLMRFWEPCDFAFTDINGQPGVVICNQQTIHASLSLCFNEQGLIHAIYITRNPEKLMHV